MSQRAASTRLRANAELASTGLVMGTFGNLSACDRAAGVFAIKPSGVPYDELTPEQIVVVSLETGAVIDSSLRPSSDTPTHLELYRAFGCGADRAYAFGVRHDVRAGAHADPLHGNDARGLFSRRHPGDAADAPRGSRTRLRKNTGSSSSRRSATRGPRRRCRPCSWRITARSHGVPTRHRRSSTRGCSNIWHALEWRGRAMAPDAAAPDSFLVDKHYLRKHGPKAYYGQK